MLGHHPGHANHYRNYHSGEGCLPVGGATGALARELCPVPRDTSDDDCGHGSSHFEAYARRDSGGGQSQGTLKVVLALCVTLLSFVNYYAW